MVRFLGTTALFLKDPMAPDSTGVWHKGMLCEIVQFLGAALGAQRCKKVRVSSSIPFKPGTAARGVWPFKQCPSSSGGAGMWSSADPHLFNDSI